MGKICIVAICSAWLWLVSLGAVVAWGAESGDSTADRWTYTFIPYVWATGIKGSISTLPPLPSASINTSFSDIIKDLDLGFMGTAEMRKGRFGIIADVFWTKLSSDVATPSGVIFNGGTLDSQMLMTTVGGAYRIAEEERVWLDLLTGIRGYYVNTDLNLRPGSGFAGSGLGARSLSDSNSTGWVDGLAGLRGQVTIWKGLYARATTVIGTGGSNLVLDLMGGMGYQFSRLFSVFAGYRYLKVDYHKSSGFIWDVEFKGPVLGIGFTF